MVVVVMVVEEGDGGRELGKKGEGGSLGYTRWRGGRDR